MPLFELVLSPRAARRAVPVLGLIAAAGVTASRTRRPPTASDHAGRAVVGVGGSAGTTRGLTTDCGRGHGLFDLDLEIERGEIFGFLGRNGAGKSTTMRLLVDLIAPTVGSATLLGLDSHGRSLEIRRRLGFLPGDFALYPELSGTTVLDYMAELRGGVRRGICRPTLPTQCPRCEEQRIVVASGKSPIRVRVWPFTAPSAVAATSGTGRVRGCG